MHCRCGPSYVPRELDSHYSEPYPRQDKVEGQQSSHTWGNTDRTESRWCTHTLEHICCCKEEKQPCNSTNIILQACKALLSATQTADTLLFQQDRGLGEQPLRSSWFPLSKKLMEHTSTISNHILCVSYHILLYTKNSQKQGGVKQARSHSTM